MPKLNIPSEYRAGLSQIKKLDTTVAADMLAALNRTLVSHAVPRPDKVAALALNSVKQSDARPSINYPAIAAALASLYGVKSRSEGTSLEEFVDDVCDAMENVPEQEFRLLPDERDKFRQNLRVLLSANVFAVASKAYDLATDDERTFCSARILTDLRPIFGPSVEEGPSGMVVVHLLKITYHQGTERHKEFFVALDGNDVRALKHVLDRAEIKAASLKSSVGDMHLFGLAKE